MIAWYQNLGGRAAADNQERAILTHVYQLRSQSPFWFCQSLGTDERITRSFLRSAATEPWSSLGSQSQMMRFGTPPMSVNSC